MKKALLLIFGLVAIPFLIHAQSAKAPAPVQPKPADSSAAKKPASKAKSYDQVITKEAKSKKGLNRRQILFRNPEKTLGERHVIS